MELENLYHTQKKMENRTVGEVSIRSDGEGKLIVGYAAVFNKLSRIIVENGKLFYEKIHPNAFDDVLSKELNVVANMYHDDERILARTKSGTLILSVDDYGLKYTFSAPNTSIGRDAVELLERGDIFESSFKYFFSPKDLTWSRDEKGVAIRTVNKVSVLKDVALVINGAFAATDVGIARRSLEEFEQREQEENRKRRELNYLLQTNTE